MFTIFLEEPIRTINILKLSKKIKTHSQRYVNGFFMEFKVLFSFSRSF